MQDQRRIEETFRHELRDHAAEGEIQRTLLRGIESLPLRRATEGLRTHPELVAPNLACLDFSIAKNGALVAYRWDGEQTLDAGKMVFVREQE